MTEPTPAELAQTYADMSDDELAELNLRRDSLTAEGRQAFNAEAARRRLNVAGRSEEMEEEDFRDRVRRWNDDDLLYFIGQNPLQTPAQQRVIHAEVQKRDLDSRTLPMALGSADPDALVVVQWFRTEAEARVVQSLLKSFGIPAESRRGGGGVRPQGTQDVPVTTTARYLDAAREVLASTPSARLDDAPTLDAEFGETEALDA